VREAALPPVVRDPERESFRAAVATILELPLDAVPEPAADADRATSRVYSRWLGGLGLGLVEVADARSFAWAGPWVGRVTPPAGRPRYVVMYGVPSGVVFDPAGGGEVDRVWIRAGFVIAAADIALARPPLPEPARTVGRLEQICVAASAGARPRACTAARGIPGRGLAGDRHTVGAGTFPSGLPGSALTLIEAEVCEAFDPPLRPEEHRRNVVTRGIDLNSLVGSEFTIGRMPCRGMRLCEPCTVVDGYASRPVLRALVHRGGLRADILAEAEIRVGDAIRVVSDNR
jgi:MOSC domain-containing protein YiiM